MTSAAQDSATRMDLVYVFDAYCGWCWGLSKQLQDYVREAEAEVTVLSGGLFSGENVAPIGRFGHIPAANERIAALTGATFGDAYSRVLEDGNLVLDSDAASIGLVALKTLAPGRDLDHAHAMQRAFYGEGRSLSDADTYRQIAHMQGLDPESVVAALSDPRVIAAAAAERQQTKQAGIRSYPTLLLRTPRGLEQIGSPVSSARDLHHAVQQRLSSDQDDGRPSSRIPDDLPHL